MRNESLARAMPGSGLEKLVMARGDRSTPCHDKLPRRRDRLDIQLREVKVPCTAGQPVHFSTLVLRRHSQRNFHARKMPAPSSSQPSNDHATYKHGAVIQSTPSLSQQPPPAANTPGKMGAPSCPQNAVTGWRARFVCWLRYAPSIEHMDGQHR